MARLIIACAECGKSTTNQGFGLCQSCYSRRRRSNSKPRNCDMCGEVRRIYCRGMRHGCYRGIKPRGVVETSIGTKLQQEWQHMHHRMGYGREYFIPWAAHGLGLTEDAVRQHLDRMGTAA